MAASAVAPLIRSPAFYRRLATSQARDALRLSQIEIRETYPAPRYWAAFEVTGSAN